MKVSNTIKPLYIQRKLLNAEEFISWAKDAGFTKVLAPEELHVTIVYSKQPVDWFAVKQDIRSMTVSGGRRSVETLGDKGAVVMKFNSLILQEDHRAWSDVGASWDYEEYQPHVTITYKNGDLDISQIKPFPGPLEFGPEILEPINADYAEQVVEKTERRRPQSIALKKLDSTSTDEKRIVWAEVYAPNTPDSGKDFMTAPEIEKMAYQFMRDMRLDQVDQMHDNKTTDGICVVESFIARPGDPDFLPGAWVVAVHVDDDSTWAKIKSGELNGFSLEALVMTETLERDLELPEIVTGLTSITEDHDHPFQVSFDTQGKFLGGNTSLVKGHMHAILAGTVTEISDGHSHRFSAVDDLKIL